TVYRAPDPEQLKVRGSERAEGGDHGPESHLPCADSGGGRGRTESVRGKMEQDAQGDRSPVATELVAGDSVFCVPAGNPTDHLHDQCGGIAEYVAAQDHENAGVVSQRTGGIEAVISGIEECFGEMGNHTSLECGLESIHAVVGGSH